MTDLIGVPVQRNRLPRSDTPRSPDAVVELAPIGLETPLGLSELTPVRRISLRAWIVMLVGLDVAMAILAAGCGVLLRFGEAPSRLHGTSYVVIAALLPPLWLAAMTLGGTYDRRHLISGPEQFRRVVNSSIWLLGFIAFMSYALRAELSRSLVAFTLALVTALTLTGRLAARGLLRRRVAKGARAIHRVLAFGTPPETQSLVAHMRRNPHTGFTVVGAFGPGAAAAAGPAPSEEPAVDAIELVAQVRRLHADAIAVAGSTALGPGGLRRLSWALEGSGVALLVVPDLTDVAGPRIVVRPVEGLPLLQIEEPELRGWRRLVKAALDRAGGVVLVILLSPVLIGIGLAIRLGGGGPALFRQTRIGLGGRRFRVWKFRTMHRDADSQFRQLLTEAGDDHALLKLHADPRVTRFGRFLRRHSLDELPQLFNVVAGSMSLVGPRPHVPDEVERFGVDARRRLLVKPGMTGLWQVSGRSDLSWEETVRLDLYYVENWSIWLDISLLLRTLGAVIESRGAY